MRDRLRKLLEGEPVVNRGFLRYLDSYELKRSAIQGCSCAAVFGFGKELFGALYSRDENEALKVAAIFKGTGGLSIEPAFSWSLSAAMGGQVPKSVLDAVKLYVPDGVSVPEPTSAPVAIGPEHAETVYLNYRRASDVDPDYIRERMQDGPAIGVFDGGKLVGWALTHDDMAMGMLTVLPEYRRKGIALDITLALIKRMRQIGEVPIVHISKDNRMSMPLVKKLGFVEVCDVLFVR